MASTLRSDKEHLRNRLQSGLLFGILTLVGLYVTSIDQSMAASSAKSQAGGQAKGQAEIQASANTSADRLDGARLSAAEKLYFGSSFEHLSTDQRLDKLERGVFGRNRSGSDEKRFERIAAALGTNKVAAVSAAADDAPAHPADQASDKTVSEAKPSVDEKAVSTAETPPSDAAVQTLLKSGMAAHRGGQIQVAEGHFKAAIALDPRCADAFYNLGSIAEGRGDMLSALTNYRAALGINPLDKELQTAVKSVEDEVSKSHATASGAVKNQPGKTAGNNASSGSIMPPTAPPFYRFNGTQNVPYQGAPPYSGYAPTSADNKLFNLQTAQNNALMQTQGGYPPVANVSQPAIPVYNVSQQQAPTLNVNQPKQPSKNSSGMNTLVNVLMQGSGLHCPICRLRSLGNW